LSLLGPPTSVVPESSEEEPTNGSDAESRGSRGRGGAQADEDGVRSPYSKKKEDVEIGFCSVMCAFNRICWYGSSALTAFCMWLALFFTFLAAAVDGIGQPVVIVFMQQKAADLAVRRDCSDARTQEGFNQAMKLLAIYIVARSVCKAIAALFALNFMVRCRVELLRAVHKIYMDPVSRSY
jgi:hypothetical protein